MSEKIFYLTTPLYYVNARPHIGHAYTNVLCDTFARFQKLSGRKVFFLTGTDEHGTKIEKEARAAGQEPRAYVDAMVPEFKKLWEILGIEYDYFIRTTDESHKRAVMKILADLEARGEIYKAVYTGWYCTPCESFWTELQLVNGKCTDCGREVQKLSEENYFFKLSKYQKWLIETIEKNPDFIRPDYRKNEILGFLREPLADLSITRLRSRLSWGIDYPNSKDHVVYVWFDALVNYISAVGYPLDDKKFKTYWPADLHWVGKDILRQHAVYWPIMLKACGLEMPKTVFAHGWWTMSGAKVSKSRGNAVDPIELCKKYSVDAFRYFLLHEVTLGQDGAFSEDLLAERYTTDLANDLGNLWFRFASMLEKYFEKRVPAAATQEEIPHRGMWEKVQGAMEAYHPKDALEWLWRGMGHLAPYGEVSNDPRAVCIANSNLYVEQHKPWVLFKEKKEDELKKTLAVLGERLAHAAYLLRPFMPHTAREILTRLQLPPDRIFKSAEEYAKPLVAPGTVVERGNALFPRLEEIPEKKNA